MYPTGRVLGPFHAVVTVAVDGPYELCAGRDGHGRPVRILALTPEASGDPLRRAGLADALGWANATHGPGDAPVTDADLHGPHPWLATPDRPDLRGVERLLDHLRGIPPPPPTAPLPPAPLLPGPPPVSSPPISGPPVSGGPFGGGPVSGPPVSGPPVSGPPVGGPPVSGPPISGPPVSGGPVSGGPMGGGRRVVPSRRRSRGARRLMAVLVGAGVAVLIVALALVTMVWVRGPGQPSAHPSASSSPEEPVPTLRAVPDAPVVGPIWRPGDTYQTVAVRGLPFAFRGPEGLACQPDQTATARTWFCADATVNPQQSPRIRIVLRRCADPCDAATRAELDRRPPEPVTGTWTTKDPTTSYVADQLGVEYRLTMSHFFGTGPTLHLMVQAVGPPGATITIQKTVNDMHAQTP